MFSTDTLAPERAEIATSAGPRSDLPDTPPPAISFGFGMLAPVDSEPVDYTGMSYDPDSQTLDVAGVPAFLLPEMATKLDVDTIYDHQKFTDTEEDKGVNDDR